LATRAFIGEQLKMFAAFARRALATDEPASSATLAGPIGQ